MKRRIQRKLRSSNEIAKSSPEEEKEESLWDKYFWLWIGLLILALGSLGGGSYYMYSGKKVKRRRRRRRRN